MTFSALVSLPPQQLTKLHQLALQQTPFPPLGQTNPAFPGTYPRPLPGLHGGCGASSPVPAQAATVTACSGDTARCGHQWLVPPPACHVCLDLSWRSGHRRAASHASCLSPGEKLSLHSSEEAPNLMGQSSGKGDARALRRPQGHRAQCHQQDLQSLGPGPGWSASSLSSNPRTWQAPSAVALWCLGVWTWPWGLPQPSVHAPLFVGLIPDVTVLRRTRGPGSQELCALPPVPT